MCVFLTNGFLLVLKLLLLPHLGFLRSGKQTKNLCVYLYVKIYLTKQPAEFMRSLYTHTVTHALILCVWLYCMVVFVYEIQFVF